MPNYAYTINEPWGVTISLTAEDGNDAQAITYSGPNAELVKSRLSEAYGAFGHIFNPDGDTPIDLDAALMSTFGPGLVERTGATPDYDPGIPQGAQT